MSPRSRVLIGSVAIVAALALFLAIMYAGGRPAKVPLAISPESIGAARLWLQQQGVDHEERQGRLLVAADRRTAVLAGLSESGVGGDRLIDFNTLIEQESPFHSQEQSRFLRLAATMGVLERMISQYRGVRSARVVIADPQRTTGLGMAHVPPTASVTVVMQRDEMSQDLVDAVAGLVAGAHPGLKVENVTVTDAMAGRRRHARRAEDLAVGTNLEQQTRLEAVVQRRIEQHLAFIPGVMVAVHAQVVTKDISRREQSFREPVIGPLSERSSATNTQGPAPSGDVGLRPNVGVSVIQSNRGQSASSEQSEQRLDPRFPSETALIRDPTGYAAKINASINVPRSYIVHLWRVRPGSSGEPDEAALEAIRLEELDRIRRSVEPLIDTDTFDGSRSGTVTVSVYADVRPEPEPEPVPTAAFVGLFGPLTGGSSMGPMIGLMAIGAVALGLMFLIAWRALPKAAPTTAVAASAESSEPAEPIGSVSPGMAADVVGEAEAETPPLEGREVDDESLRRRQMLKQINEMVDRSPTEAASLLRRWMRAAG
ncbi:MAG: hypothetical protein KF724_09675 [Phycisphaeraceae bacterium]|nr:hypothetical protein [Phycisphaeraceae bacterium]